MSTGLITMFIILTEPSFLALWNIGSEAYPLGQRQFLACLVLAIISYVVEQAQNRAITSDESVSYIVACFMVISLLVTLIFDVAHFKVQVSTFNIVSVVITILISIAYTVYTYRQRSTQLEESDEDEPVTRFSAKFSDF